MTFEISQLMCFGKSLVWFDLCVKLHLTILIFLIKGQAVHLPSLVQMVGFGMVEVFICGGYNIEAFVNMSLRLRSLLNPIIGFF